MQLGSFDLNLLVALDVLLEENNVSRAAERLRVGQPAMSSTLARLRAVFDDPLFVRSGRGVKPTPFAISLKEPIRATLGQVQAIINAGSTFDPATDHRTFTIVASDYAALILLRPLIERLGSVAPNLQIRMQLVEADSIDRMRRGLADLVIMPRELLPQRLVDPWEKLFEDDFVCVVATDNPDVGDDLSLEQFSQLPYLVSSSSGNDFTSIVENRLDDLGIPRNTQMAANSFVMAAFLLPGTRLLTVLQRKLAAALVAENSGFRVVPTPVGLDEITELMLWPPKLTSDSGHAWLRAQLIELARLL